MPFLPSNQQCQSTEGLFLKYCKICKRKIFTENCGHLENDERLVNLTRAFIFIFMLCYSIFRLGLQCFDAVGWAEGRASGPLKLSDEVLVWLSVWSEVQMIAYGPVDASATQSSLASLKSRMVWPFWYRFTQVVL